MFVPVLLAFIPLYVYGSLYGLLVWGILYACLMGFALYVERIKKDHDLSTYQEIVAFSEGKTLDEIQKQREMGKRPYQTVLKVMCGMAVGLILAAAAFWIAGF